MASVIIEGISDEEEQEIITNFVKLYYSQYNDIPDEILVQYPLNDSKLIRDWL